LVVSVPVQQGRTYAFSKYIAVSRQNWAGDSNATLASPELRDRLVSSGLLDAHRAA